MFINQCSAQLGYQHRCSWLRWSFKDRDALAGLWENDHNRLRTSCQHGLHDTSSAPVHCVYVDLQVVSRSLRRLFGLQCKFSMHSRAAIKLDLSKAECAWCSSGIPLRDESLGKIENTDRCRRFCVLTECSPD